MTLLLCVRQLTAQEGVFGVVSDTESTVGALHTYEVYGHCRNDIHHL